METFEEKHHRRYGTGSAFWDDIEDDFYESYERYLEDDEISAAEAAFLKGLEMADEDDDYSPPQMAD
ncbi:hypothetical protein HYU18_00030 [Candidatus Woesearchaeota archaeon]|nr:hypothetical protein [Candidatus Woesearchaeota archaeon]